MASQLTEADPAKQDDAAEPSAPASSASARAAAWVFAVYIVVAFPVIVFGLGNYHWFLGDDWDFLADRQVGSLDDLFRPHAEHWSTLPVLVYRLEWNLFGFHYSAYQAVTVALHLTAAVLLRVVMRRAGVHPWIATATAALFVLFGPGSQNILWSFQIGMVGSMVFGLTHLILADREGGRQRADWLGLLAGLGGLMCSGIGPVMVAVVGLAVWLRRGWRMAAFHVLPLAAIFLVWFGAYRDEQPASAGHVGPSALASWFRRGLLTQFQALGYGAILGLVLAVLLVVGLGLVWLPLARARDWTGLRRRASLPLAMLAGYIAFQSLTANSRWSFGSEVAESPRYLHIGALLLLPALAVATDAVGRRWRLALPIVVIVLLLPIPGNIKEFDASEPGPFSEPYFDHQRSLVQGIARSRLARQVRRSDRPVRDILGGEGPSIGWLLDADRRGRVPDPGPLPPEVRDQILVRLGVAQATTAPAASKAARRCRTYRAPLRLDPRKGDTFRLLTDLGVRLRNASTPTLFAEKFSPLAGQELRIALDGLHLTFAPLAPAKSFGICS